MKKFISDWKFRYSIFTLKESVIVTCGILFILVGIVFGPIILIDNLQTNKVVLTLDRGTFTNGNSSKKIKVKKDSQVLLPRESSIKVNEDFLFDGWTDGDKKFNYSEIITRDVNLKPIWIKVTREAKIVEEIIPFSEITKEDDSIFEGESVVEIEGKEGRKLFHSTMIYHNGEYNSEKFDREENVRQPVTRVIKVGTKKKELTPQNPSNNGSLADANQGIKPNNNSNNTNAPVNKVPKPKPATGNYTPIHGVGLINNDKNDNFANCTELRKVYVNGVPKGHPAYTSGMDRDKDDWACEKK